MARALQALASPAGRKVTCTSYGALAMHWWPLSGPVSGSGQAACCPGCLVSTLAYKQAAEMQLGRMPAAAILLQSLMYLVSS